MTEDMKVAWLEISRMLGEPTREELDVFLRTWQRASQATREALAEQPAQQEPVRVPVTDSTYNYAKSLAEAMFKQHFASDEHYSSGRIVWGVNDTVIGILTQIDNMVADMVRKPAQQEPVGKVNELFDEAVIEQCGFDRELLVYTSPPAQRTWVGLTDEEISARAANFYNPEMYKRAALWAQEKLKERNQ